MNYRVMATRTWDNPSQCQGWLNDFCTRNNCKLVGVDGFYYIFESNDSEINNGGLSYRGFSVPVMLNYLHKFNHEFNLVKVGEDWRLYAYSDEHGEFERTGSLSWLVMQAFKPFAEKAIKDKAQAKSLLEHIGFE